MVEDKWLLLASIPVVVFLSLSIRRRLRDLNARIEQLKREDAAGPINPYQAMYEAMAAGPMKPIANGSLRLSAPEQSGSMLKQAPEDDQSEGTNPPRFPSSGEPEDTDTSRRQLEDNDG